MKKEEMILTVKALNQCVRNQNLSDFKVERLENGTVSLVGSFDLSYYYDIEIVITNVSRLSLCCYFYVDLLKSEPFSVHFPTDDTAILCFEDCSIQQQGEIEFEGGIMFHVKHVSYEN